MDQASRRAYRFYAPHNSPRNIFYWPLKVSKVHAILILSLRVGCGSYHTGGPVLAVRQAFQP